MTMRIEVIVALLLGVSGAAGAQATTTHKQPPTRQQASAAKSATQKPTPPARPALHVAKGDTAAPPPVIMREVFTYVANGRRDPFYPLLNTSELRPAISDLTLAGILQDNSGHGRSVAILKDAQSNQYRVRVGSTLGRMQVAAIHRNSVVFTIEEFGASRQDSLVLNDSTTTRSK